MARMIEWVNLRQLGELTDETLASEILARSSWRNHCRRHCHSRAVLCLLGPAGSDRGDGVKLCEILVGARRDTSNRTRSDQSNGAAVSRDDFRIAAGFSWRNRVRLAKLQQDADLGPLLAVKPDQQNER